MTLIILLVIGILYELLAFVEEYGRYNLRKTAVWYCMDICYYVVLLYLSFFSHSLYLQITAAVIFLMAVVQELILKRMNRMMNFFDIGLCLLLLSSGLSTVLKL